MTVVIKLSTLRQRVQNADTRRVISPPIVKRLRGRRLQDRRRRMLRENPLCEQCASAGRVTAATQLDHLIPLHLGGADEESNLQRLCDDCHDAKTRQEAAERSGRIPSRQPWPDAPAG